MDDKKLKALQNRMTTAWHGDGAESMGRKKSETVGWFFALLESET